MYTNSMCSLLITTVLVIVSGCYAVKLDDTFAWRQIEFVWPSEADKVNALQTKQYIPENNLPLGINRWNDKLFVTVPRWKSGVIATLTYLPLNSTNKSPLFVPYPSLKANEIPVDKKYHEQDHDQGVNTRPKAADVETAENKTARDDQLVSVFRIRIDECDRLWAVDTGLADLLDNPRQIRKPAIIIFDLKTDTLVRRYEFKSSDLKEDSFFANVVVEVTPDTCNDAFAYIPDLGGYGLVVYSFKDNNSWRIQHNFFHFDPLAGDYNVGGVNFQWTDGVFGLALSKLQSDGFRTLFFHALSSTKEFAVSTAILRNETIATDPHSYYEYRLLGERGMYTQATASFLDEKTGVLFFTQVNKNGVACWNPMKPLSPETFALIAKDDNDIIFPNDLTIDKENQLWVLSNKMPIFIYKKLDPNEINYRIMKTKISDAIKNTPCA